ncbi:GLPGLI family protein [Flavobacterium jejuense]|uniref:GLPGLI family protein n=1 Tax=Flavobacterium jejuense TaxID=1544455 RepID=A0ABX0IQX4_9FLAO|nr:GLPGLI family protein [Flavobacterium jejuense]NHN25204.1 GLPGLI family protein [Flavobacterium jejuense]
MKTLFIAFLLFFQLSYSQSEITLKVQYNEFIAQHPKIVMKNIGALYMSKDFSFYKVEPIESEKKSEIEDGQTIILDSNEKDFLFSEIIVNNKEKTLTETLYENLFLKKHYAVKENLSVMKWEILDDEKKINNYLCKSAQITFRGRSYTAWYTEQIPIFSGPWKFNGLPGLILSVSDKKGIYKWEVKSITYPYKGKEIDLKKININNPKFKSISYKDFDIKRIKAINEKIEMIRARNANRTENKASYSYSTFLEKEPTNEWRTKFFFD